MKINSVTLTMKDRELALKCGMARLNNPEDDGILTLEEAEKYQGATFEDGVTCEDLHLVIRDGVYFVNFLENGERVSYGYPISEFGRIRYTQNPK